MPALRHAPARRLAAPRAGDVAICWRCRGISIFSAGPLGMERRLPTAEEDAEVRADPAVRRALAAMSESYGPTTAAALARGDHHG
jgi:hypothetical protein